MSTFLQSIVFSQQFILVLYNFKSIHIEYKFNYLLTKIIILSIKKLLFSRILTTHCPNYCLIIVVHI